MSIAYKRLWGKLVTVCQMLNYNKIDAELLYDFTVAK
jgi:hypothetical protein